MIRVLTTVDWTAANVSHCRAVTESEPLVVSVVIPAYNEEEVIADTVAEAAEVLASLPGRHEILVCDDGSSDGTLAILRDLEPRFPMLRVFVHEQNRGNPAAQATLVMAARGKYVFHIGADREWRMAELVPMLERLEAGADIVIGVRRKKQYTLARKIVSGGYNWLVALLWGRHFGDLGSLRMARAALWQQIPFNSESAFLHAERILIAHFNGAVIETVPVDHVARTTGASKFAHPTAAVAAMAELVKFRLSSRSRYRLRDWREGSPGPSGCP
jgi:glycosyltransferase involved in cell wall biosynthesis